VYEPEPAAIISQHHKGAARSCTGDKAPFDYKRGNLTRRNGFA
jgi:hypothetical protein